MTKLNDFQRLENVIIYINRIGYYTENLSEGNFNKDQKTVDAVLYCIQQMGKNIAEISKDFHKLHTEISELDWILLSMLRMDGYFSDEELWDVLNDEIRGVFSHYHDLEAIYLKERQKPENKAVARIPVRFIRRDDEIRLPLKNISKEKPKSGIKPDNEKGYNPRSHIATHASIWTVKKR